MSPKPSIVLTLTTQDDGVVTTQAMGKIIEIFPSQIKKEIKDSLELTVSRLPDIQINTVVLAKSNGQRDKPPIEITLLLENIALANQETADLFASCLSISLNQANMTGHHVGLNTIFRRTISTFFAEV